MQDRIDHAFDRAVQARARAASCRDAYGREHWLYVAGAWENLAHTCAEFDRLRREALPSHPRYPRE